MLPKLQKQELLTWLELLKGFHVVLFKSEKNVSEIKSNWQKINEYLQKTILNITQENREISNISLFQSWQTETHRYIRLINTDLMFFYSAKQPHLQQQRLTFINQRLEAVMTLTEDFLTSF